MSNEEFKRVGPQWLDNDNKNKVKKSKKHEFRLAAELGGKREIRSGANKFSPYDGDTRTAGRDITTDQFLIEHKFTEAQSMSVKKEWLDKIKLSSVAAMKNPMLIITFHQEHKQPEDWAVIPLHLLKQLIENKD